MGAQLNKIFVQHVPKTAGTSLLHFLEPNFSNTRIFTSEQFNKRWGANAEDKKIIGNTRYPFLVRTPPFATEPLLYAHGHFRDYLRQALFGDWFSIGTCRSIDERLVSSLNHQIRDPQMEKHAAIYLLENKSGPKAVLQALINNSHLSFYCTQSTKHVVSDDANPSEALKQMAVEALNNIDKYSYIIDSEHFFDHCENIGRQLKNHNNIGRFNSRQSFGQKSNFSIQSLGKLHNEFSDFFDLEEKIYKKLKKRSEQCLGEDVQNILDSILTRRSESISISPDCADISYMSRAIEVSLLGWEGNYLRELIPGASINNINIKAGRHEMFIWLWSGDPERHRLLDIQIDNGDELSKEVSLLEYPACYLWLVKLRLYCESDKIINVTFREPDSDKRTCWLGTKIYFLGNNQQ